MTADEPAQRAKLLYEQAIFTGDAGPLAAADRELDAAEADLALARGRVAHGRFLVARDAGQAAENPAELPLFGRAAELYRGLGDERGEAAALFWAGCFHQVVRGDDGTAVPLLERSLELARRVRDEETMAEALRHLGIAAHRAGRLDEAADRLEESCRLRRAAGQPASLAANLVGLAYIAAAQGHRDKAGERLAEADRLAAGAGAHSVRQHVAEARAALLPG
ncbi:MAG TPA: tetratricopeptide repeat protein [Streptosporangiaceae bacterium]